MFTQKTSNDTCMLVNAVLASATVAAFLNSLEEKEENMLKNGI